MTTNIVSPSIAYVDDDHDLLEVVSMCFQVFSELSIDTYSLPQDFQETYKPGLYELLLVDYMMPCLTGPELAEWVRNVRQDTDTKIILVTAKNLVGEQPFLTSGLISGVITKPFSPENVTNEILTIYSSK